MGTNFGLLVHVFPRPNKQREAKPSILLSWIEGKTISPAASFVLGIHFSNSYFCDSRCPFGQIDNRKHMLERFRSHFHRMCWHADLKKASRPFDCCKLDLMGHRWPKVQSDLYVHIRISLIYNTFLVIALASRSNKQREAKPSTHLAFSWDTLKLSSLILWNARVTVSQSFSCLERVHPVQYFVYFRVQIRDARANQAWFWAKLGEKQLAWSPRSY